MYCDWPELGRCCFCLPLRKGVLIFGYANIFFCAFVIGLYSYTIHSGPGSELPSYGRILMFPAELCIVINCAELIFDAVLIYGAHKKSLIHIKAYYYFSLTTAIAIVVLQVIDLIVEGYHTGIVLELLTFIFAGFCMQVYLITIVRSLLKKMEISGPHVYDNQLHQIVSGDYKVETNGVYNNTTAPTEI